MNMLFRLLTKKKIVVKYLTLLWMSIKNLDPSDYIYFLENGELMERKLECPKTEKKQMPSGNK